MKHFRKIYIGLVFLFLFESKNIGKSIINFGGAHKYAKRHTVVILRTSK